MLLTSSLSLSLAFLWAVLGLLAGGCSLVVSSSLTDSRRGFVCSHWVGEPIGDGRESIMVPVRYPY